MIIETHLLFPASFLIGFSFDDEIFDLFLGVIGIRFVKYSYYANDEDDDE